MNGAVLSHRQDPGVCRVCVSLGPTPVRGVWKRLSGGSIPPLFHAPPLCIAGILPLYHSRFARESHLLTHPCSGVCLTASRECKVRWQVTYQLMPSAFCSASFYTLSRGSEALMKRVGEEHSHRTPERESKA